jgi:hypothetical protein
MNPGAIFLLLVVLVLVALFVARPFIIRQRVYPETGKAMSALLAERERLLTALQELDFDHTLGKVPEEDYPGQRDLLVQRGATILRQLDELEAAQKPVLKTLGESTTPGLVKKSALVSDEDLEELIAKRRSNRKEKTGGFCPQCGKPILLSDAFCPSCGNVLKNNG